MRKVIVRDLVSNTSFTLSYDVSVICEVMERGKAIDEITYELKVNGKELLEFIREMKIENTTNINESSEYEIVAFDW